MSYPAQVVDEKGAGYPPEQPTEYPPQQQGYPPQQPGYPPQQASGYPPQQPGYPPQQPGYPPQPPGYPPQQPTGYPPQSEYKTDAPPPYYPGQHEPPPVAAQQPIPVQQTSSNVVVVNQQPTTPYHTRVVHPTGDHYLTLSIVLTIVCCLCGTWCSLCCTLPAIILATQARDADARGDVAGAQSQGRIALGCNIAACVWWVLALAIWIGLVVGVRANGESYYSGYSYYRGYSSSDCYYNSYNSYYYC